MSAVPADEAKAATEANEAAERAGVRAGGTGAALGANVLLRVAGQAAGLALTRRLVTLPAVGPAEVGLLGGLADALELVVAIPAGELSDRWGRRPLLLFGAAVGAVGLLVAGSGETIPTLALGRALQGLGTGCTIPALLGWFSDMTAARDARGRARVMSGVGAGTAAGLLFGTVLGSVLWTQLGTAAFPILAALFFSATALMARAPGGPGAPGGGTAAGAIAVSSRGLWRDVQQTLETPGLIRLLIAWLLLNAVVGLWLTHAVYQLDLPRTDEAQFLVGRFHGAALDALLVAWMALFIAGSLAWGWLLPGVGEWRAMRVALAGMLLVCAALTVLNAGAVPALWRWVALAPFCVGVLMEAGFAPAALSELAAGADRRRRGVTMALYSVVFGAGSLLGNWLGTPFVALGQMNGIIAATALTAALALAVLSLPAHSVRRAPSAVAPG